METLLNKIQYHIKKKQYLIASHAKLRMAERLINTIDLEKAIKNGEIIEEYPDDKPCPSVLLLGKVNSKPIHIVIGICEDHIRIITEYIPSSKRWINYKTRR
jgi:hypothetical protein